MQLAREVLANLEAGEQDNLFAQAQDLQALFQENLTIEREKNQELGREGKCEPVTFDPIRIEALTTSATFIETGSILESPTKLLPFPKDQGEEKHQLSPSEALVLTGGPTPPADPVTVTIIHTSITTGQDPWADLRAKHLKPRRQRRLITAYSEDMPGLWSVLNAVPEQVKDQQESLVQRDQGSVIQSSLW